MGTHALLSEGTRFGRLGLVVIDEQHRFGVEQRAALLRKAGTPHCLVLTATPTPDPSAVIQCSPEITVIQNNAVVGDVISAPSSGQPATATRPLAAGTYTLRMRSWWNHACTMTLTVNPA